VTNHDPKRFVAIIGRLWRRPADRGLAAILPADLESLECFYDRLRAFVESAPRNHAGEIGSHACIEGEIVSMGPGSIIESGAVIHRSCRLILGAGSIVRAGAVLRDEVVVGPDSLIGAHCEVVRTLILGPCTYLGHFNYVADSIIGADVNIAGNLMIANRTVTRRASIVLDHDGAKIDSGRSHLGALIGDGVRFGASTTICPGCIVLPELALPPGVILHGTIDAAHRRRLMRLFSSTWAADRAGRRHARPQCSTHGEPR